MNSSIKERNYGIDLLKIFSMMGIIMLHVLNNGGVISNVAIGRKSYILMNLMYTICYASVNVFAIITGYVYSKKSKTSTKPLLNLLLITFFYSLVISLIFGVFNLKDVRDKGNKYILYGLFPFLMGRYWYITCYVFVFALIGYINKFIDNIEQKDFLRLLLIIFVLISVCTTLLGVVNLFLKESKYIDLFVINSGYSPFWLIYCYLIGAYIRKYNDNINIKRVLLVLITCVIVACISNYLTKVITNKVFSKIRLNDLFVSYISPFNVIISICLVLLFKNLKLKNAVIYTISKATFGIYIIHSHLFLHDLVFKNRFVFLSSKNMLVMIGACLLIDFAIFIICLIIELIRKKMFDIIHVNKLIEAIDKRIFILEK